MYASNVTAVTMNMI